MKKALKPCMAKSAKPQTKSMRFSDTTDADAGRLDAFCDELGPLVRRWFKLRKAEITYGISAAKVIQRRHSMLDHLLSLCDDPEWLRRAQAIHLDEKAFYARKKAAYLAGDEKGS